MHRRDLLVRGAATSAVLLAATAVLASPGIARPARLALPGGEAGIGFDDLMFAPALHRVLAPAGRTGKLVLIDPRTQRIESVAGFSADADKFAGGHGEGTTSADAGGGLIFASDRSRTEVEIKAHGRISMKVLRATAVIGVFTLAIGAVGADDAARAKPTTWSFDADKPDQPPAGFHFGRTGGGKEGKWVVLAAKDAPSAGNVLAQVDADRTDYRFPVAVADSPSLADLSLSVKCKPVSGDVDQGCGLVFRYQDADNYYLTRANALEDNVNLYHVKKGRRVQITGWSGKVKSGVWHDFKIDAKGEHFLVTFDGKQVIDATDKTFTRAGKVGVWTKADSVIYFDDLKVEPR